MSTFTRRSSTPAKIGSGGRRARHSRKQRGVLVVGDGSEGEVCCAAALERVSLGACSPRIRHSSCSGKMRMPRQSGIF